MRLPCQNPLRIRNQLIGGSRFLICLPLVAKDLSRLTSQAQRLMEYRPDLVEWRVDGYERAHELTACLEALKEVRRICGEIPVIFTFRSPAEGGMQTVSESIRLTIIEAALASNMVDLVDLEMISGKTEIEWIKASAVRNEVKLILSHHNFDSTPEEQFIINKLTQAQTLGADIAKIALMPKNSVDVLTLLHATYKARSGPVSIPLLTISMGEAGAISRICGGQFGSDITFAAHEVSSAPGQIGIEELRQAIALLS